MLKRLIGHGLVMSTKALRCNILTVNPEFPAFSEFVALLAAIADVKPYYHDLVNREHLNPPVY